MKASELVERLRGPTGAMFDAADRKEAADLIEAQAKALEAAKALLDHWDERGGPEKRGSYGGVEYWSPAGRMVDTQLIADLRQALASHSQEGEQG